MPDIEKIQNIGILGGTFDPVHEGHLVVARKLCSRYKLDLILFIPAAFPPHKLQTSASYSHRVAMLEAALQNEQQMVVSLIESERPDPSYTIDTLFELQKRLGEKNFHLIIGADSFAELHLWYRFAELFKLANLIVASRPGYTFETFLKNLKTIPGGSTWDSTEEKWLLRSGKSISYFREIRQIVSSTLIRKLIGQNKPVDELVPREVLKYIQCNEMYINL